MPEQIKDEGAGEAPTVPRRPPQETSPTIDARLIPKEVVSPRRSPAPSSRVEAQASIADRWIGPYHLVEVLGEGGMGTVYLAEQKEPVARMVALKLMRSTISGPVAAGRFAAERQALARLSHPHIAALYEGGATREGFPYFVMERVEGTPVTDYCDGRKLSVGKRVELFIQICAGVQHAHQRGLLHRDIKPSNILVSEVEGRGIPKIIDFGISKALDEPLGESKQWTAMGTIGTPAYMSPEALNLGSDDLDTRTDVYSLGVMLYELIAGERPYDTTGVALTTLARTVMEEEAPSARSRFRSLPEEAQRRIAAERGEDSASLARKLSGDLGSILAKAIARDRDERYASAADLAADLTRYLRDEPVLATPPSVLYRSRKFVRRHRAAVAAAGLVLVAVVAGIVSTMVQAVRAERSRAAAEAEAGFLFALIDAGSPWSRQKETTVRQLVDEAASRIGTDLKDQPAARAELLASIGESEFHLGHLTTAEPLLRESLRIRTQLYGDRSAEAADALNTLGLIRKHRGYLADAERMLRESLAIREHVFGREHTSVAHALFDLASVLHERGRNQEAEAAYRESLALRELLSARPDGMVDAVSVAMTMNGLAQFYTSTGRYTEAEPLFRKAIELRQSNHDVGYGYASSLEALAEMMSQQRRWAEAEPLNREALQLMEKFVDPQDARVATAANDLGVVLREEGRPAEAEPLLRRAVAIDEATSDLDQSTLDKVRADLGILLYWRGEYPEAAKWLGTALQGAAAAGGTAEPWVIEARSAVAEIQRRGRVVIPTSR